MKSELLHENGFEFEANLKHYQQAVIFDDAISVLNKNMKHACAIEFTL